MRKSASAVAFMFFWSAFLSLARPEDQEMTHVVVSVVDPSGAAIPDAEVWIGTASDSLKPFLLANDRGMLAADMEPGKYEIEAQFPGFREQRQPLTVSKKAEQRVNIVLQLGGCSPCIAVENWPVPEPAVPLPNPSTNEVPTECHRPGNLPAIGFPVFSKTNSGMRFGVSF